MSLEGKVVIITGGAKGIGRYNARLFAEAGAHVAIADIEPMGTVTAEVEQRDAEVLAVPTDLRVEDEVRSLMAAVHERFGRIDVLINNAGVVPHFQWGMPHWDRIRDMDLAFFDNVMRTNLNGTFLCVKHVLPYMEAQRSGVIINLGQGNLSPDTREDGIGSAVYSTSKLAIRAFTANMAIEEREHNVCVISMGPGGYVPPGSRAEGRRGIATEEAPAEARARMMSVPEVVGDRYLLAAEAPMALSGYQVDAVDGELVVAQN